MTPESMSPSSKTSARTKGGVHHVAYVVENADTAACFHEQAYGWTRLMAETAKPEEAHIWGLVLGVHDATEFSLVMLEPPEGQPCANIEFVDFRTPRGTGGELHPGMVVTSYRVHDMDAAWTAVTSMGAEPVMLPAERSVGDWKIRAAAYRQVGGGLVELVQIGGRSAAD